MAGCAGWEVGYWRNCTLGGLFPSPRMEQGYFVPLVFMGFPVLQKLQPFHVSFWANTSMFFMSLCQWMHIWRYVSITCAICRIAPWLYFRCYAPYLNPQDLEGYVLILAPTEVHELASRNCRLKRKAGAALSGSVPFSCPVLSCCLCGVATALGLCLCPWPLLP